MMHQLKDGTWINLDSVSMLEVDKSMTPIEDGKFMLEIYFQRIHHRVRFNTRQEAEALRDELAKLINELMGFLT